jgi:hypothetical protein
MSNGIGTYPVQLTMGATVTATITGGANYFYLALSGGNVTTFSFTNSDTQNPEKVWVVMKQDSSARTVGFASNIVNNSLVVSTTINSTTVMEFFYDTSTQQWFLMELGKTG